MTEADSESGQGELLTVQDAARRTGLAETTLRTAMSQKRLPFIRRWGRKLIKNADIDAYIRRYHPGGIVRRGRPPQSK